jgi:hypothetical protein
LSYARTRSWSIPVTTSPLNDDRFSSIPPCAFQCTYVVAPSPCELSWIFRQGITDRTPLFFPTLPALWRSQCLLFPARRASGCDPGALSPKSLGGPPRPIRPPFSRSSCAMRLATI